MKEIKLRPIRTLLWDLDGTLLQVSMKEFIPAYLGGLYRHLGPDIDEQLFSRSVRGIIGGMLGERVPTGSNEETFLLGLKQTMGIAPERFRRAFDAFCDDGLTDLADLVKPLPLVPNLLAKARQRGLEMVIATNPVFPRRIIEARLHSAGLSESDFSLVTCFEETRYCKPQAGFFDDLLVTIDRRPKECLMIGNDTEHDLAAGRCGIPTYLLETNLIDRAGGDYICDFRGDHRQLLSFFDRLGAG